MQILHAVSGFAPPVGRSHRGNEKRIHRTAKNVQQSSNYRTGWFRSQYDFITVSQFGMDGMVSGAMRRWRAWRLHSVDSRYSKRLGFSVDVIIQYFDLC